MRAREGERGMQQQQSSNAFIENLQGDYAIIKFKLAPNVRLNCGHLVLNQNRSISRDVLPSVLTHGAY